MLFLVKYEDTYPQNASFPIFLQDTVLTITVFSFYPPYGA